MTDLIKELGIDEAEYRATAKAIKHDIEATIGRPLPVADNGRYLRDDIEFGSEEYFRAQEAIDECRVLATYYPDDAALEAALAETREFNQKGTAAHHRRAQYFRGTLRRTSLLRVEDLKTPASRYWNNIRPRSPRRAANSTYQFTSQPKTIRGGFSWTPCISGSDIITPTGASWCTRERIGHPTSGTSRDKRRTQSRDGDNRRLHHARRLK